MLEATCLCGTVRWRTDRTPDLMSHCHCSRCRKSHGTPFATFAAVPQGALTLEGREMVGHWRSSAQLERTFCKRCGSIVPSTEPFEGRVFVPVGNFEQDPGSRPLAHIFAGSKAPWYEITDSLPRFDTYPEGMGEAVADREPLDPPGKTRGSCLCGAIAYVLEVEPQRAYFCHCKRCRRARSAAHASNLFLPAEGLRFTRGEELRSFYKVPDAERFTQTFCSVCGSKMPRSSPERGTAVVPMGSLDDDPGFRVQSHIFVAFKAPWFEITGDLPQFDEYPV